VIHALINALLGTMGEGDIGTHYPDHDPRYKGIASGKMLTGVLDIMRHKRLRIVNADITVLAQEPKLAAYYARMRKSVAGLCKVSSERISIKATTTERLGWVGAGKGVAVTALFLQCR